MTESSGHGAPMVGGLRAWCLGAALAALLSAGIATAQETRVNGSISATLVDDLGTGTLHVTFECRGEPVCRGTYSVASRATGCTNTIHTSGGLTLTGFDLSRTGAFGGTFTAEDAEYNDHIGQNGFCTVRAGTHRDLVHNYLATWDGRNGTLTLPQLPGEPEDGLEPFDISGTFTADRSAPPPVFPMTVQASFDTTARVAATFQPRPQDAGTSQSVFAFAIAPVTVVKSTGAKAAHFGHMAKGAKDTPVQCVLAQLNSAGQLVGVSASNMQAYVTGVLSAQGQAVTIVNGVPTANVAGATFYVGYGQNADAMLKQGVNRSAATAPGAVQCKPEAPETGWWWNTAEGGRGYSVEVRGHNIFFAAFHYDVSGRSTWHVATGPVSLDGSLYQGDLLAASGGQTLGGAYGGRPNITAVGPLTLAFSDKRHGTMVWPGGTVAIERFNIVADGIDAAPKANQPESGWWWNEAESGRGFFLEWQNGWVDIAGYMYDEQGNPVWYLGVYETPNIRAIGGNWWQYANGQTMGGAYKPATQISNSVAPVTVTFSGPDTALMTLPNGRTTQLQRHRF